MLYFANPSTDNVRAAMSRGDLGCIVTPAQRQAIPEGATWCADNGCFGKGWPGEAAWWAWVQRLPRDRCAFVVAPDKPFEALASLDRSLPWLPLIRALGLPAALVAQNGFENIPAVPWDEFDVLFLGGTLECLPCGYVRPVGDFDTTRCPVCARRLIEWKLAAAAAELAADAQARGKTVHMGRVNSRQRARYALAIGCASADGTFIKRGPDKNLPRMQGWLREIHDQGVLL